MKLKEYEASRTALQTLAKSIADAKRPDYTIGNEDVLHNFKGVAERVGITPLQAWAVYFLKHVDAICAYAKGNTNPSEPIDGRFADLENYLYLGKGLIDEAKPQSKPATTKSMFQGTQGMPLLDRIKLSDLAKLPMVRNEQKEKAEEVMKAVFNATPAPLPLGAKPTPKPHDELRSTPLIVHIRMRSAA